MATFTAELVSILEIELLYGNTDLGSHPEPDYLLSAAISTPLLSATRDDTQPVDEPENTFTAIEVPHFGFLDWYNKIHLQYQLIELGAVTAAQEIEFRVFNGYFVPRTLNEITVVGDSGIVLNDPGTPPYDYAPLEEKTYTLEVSESGPFRINASILFDFDIVDLEVIVTGIRVVAWRWSPNWESGIRERLEWKTDVLTAYNAEEQRRQLRILPKQYWEFTFDIEGQQLRIFDNILFDWGSRIWALPVWPDVEVLKTTLSIGTSSIPVATATRAYKVGDLVTLVAHDDSNHESIEIVTVNPTSVETVTPTTQTWGPGTRVYPTVLGYLENAPSVTKFLRTYGYGVAQFRSDRGIEHAALDDAPEYRDYPVLEDIPGIDPSLMYERKNALLDFQIGKTFLDDESEMPWQVFSLKWQFMSREEVDHFRKWLYARAGRAKGVWIPTFADDLVLVGNVQPAQLNLDIEFAGVALFSKANVHRRDIRILLNDGTVFYRRIGLPETVDDNTERISINLPLGVEIDPEDVKFISWMMLCRMDSDSTEIIWNSPQLAEAQTILRGYNSGV